MNPRERTDVALGAENFLERVGDAVRTTVAASRRRFGVCHGCRRYLPVQRWAQSHQRYCMGCISEYFGVIFD